jgi:hypothetical protein
MGGRMFTDKLVFRWLEGFGVWSLDRATTFFSAYPAHASGSSQRLIEDILNEGFVEILVDPSWKRKRLRGGSFSRSRFGSTSSRSW